MNNMSIWNFLACNHVMRTKLINTKVYVCINTLIMYNIPWIRDPDQGSVRDGEKIRIRDPEGKSRIIFPRAYRNNILGLKYLNPLIRIRIRDLFDPGSGILDGKIRIRDPVLISRIRNTAYIGKLFTSLTYTYIVLYSASICIVALFFIL